MASHTSLGLVTTWTLIFFEFVFLSILFVRMGLVLDAISFTIQQLTLKQETLYYVAALFI